jgi:two-component system sensor histidine kinase VanS
MKMFLQVVLIAVAAPVIGIIIQRILIDGIFQASFAEGFVRFFEKRFGLSYNAAAFIYQMLFRKNKYLWMAGGLFVLTLVIFCFTLLRMTKYFNEVSAGMNMLVEDSGREISLSPEMDFMEAKLNKIKTILEKRERDAAEAEQRKNDLVVYLAHDIKTPLTSVIGYLSLLDEAHDMPEEQKEKYIGITLEKAYRLEHLINEFFEITRFNLQSIVLNKEKINLHFMLQQMADEFYPMLTPQGKSMAVNAPENLTLWGDADKLARVFNNIIKNAIAYSYDDSIIEIDAALQGEDVIITFTNMGNPIPLRNLDTIFEKFYRMDSSRSSNTGGAGLGLAIAKEIVTAHNGTIKAESTIEHTMFTVTLPNYETEIRKS